ncbi:DUF3883 domain-containing protein [Nocardia sp. NPDC003726]
MASLAPRASVGDWVRSARMHGSYLAAAVDITSYAEAMLAYGLARIDDKVVVSPMLDVAAETGGRTAMNEVARLLLCLHPPIWLTLAVHENKVSREYIPTSDLDALLWLEPNLDRILIAARSEVSSDAAAALAKEIGDAAELFVLAALRYQGLSPVHVAKLSDSYGYDIEIPGPEADRIEVKAAGRRTAGTFHISRNEFDRCLQYRSRWRLIQVVFDSAAFAVDVIDPSHVVSIREVSYDILRDLAPPDTSAFAWEKSAVMTPSKNAWRNSNLMLDPNFRLPGFGQWFR